MPSAEPRSVFPRLDRLVVKDKRKEVILVLLEGLISPKVIGPNNGEVDNRAEKKSHSLLRGSFQRYKLVKRISCFGEKVFTYTLTVHFKLEIFGT